jgi:hypothetical protein
MGVATALALMAPVGVAVAKPAGAAPIVTCAKPSGAVTFVPGLGTTKKIQTTKFNLPVKNCKGTGGVKSGTSTGSTKGTKPENCATFGSNPSGVKTKVTIKWNTGKSSVATLSTVVKPAPGGLTATVSGKITTGEFKGKTIKTKVKVTLKGACSDANPLKKAVLTGLAPLTIG